MKIVETMYICTSVWYNEMCQLLSISFCCNRLKRGRPTVGRELQVGTMYALPFNYFN